MKEILYTALAAVVLLAGCSKEKDEKPAGRVAAEFTEAAITRVANNKWEADDAIGVYMVAKDAVLTDAAVLEDAKNIRHTVDAALLGKFTPANTFEKIYFPTTGSAVDFYAYYPYQAEMVDGMYQVDVSSQSDFSAIDLLTALVEGKNKTTPNVAFEFAHQLSKLSITTSAGDGFTAADLKGLKVVIKGLPATAEYHIATGVVSNTGAATDLTAAVNAAGTFAEAILIPRNTFAPGSVQVIFTLADGMKFEWNLAARALASGCNYTYTLKLNRTGVTLSSQNITPWTPGNGTGENGTADNMPFETVSIPAGTFQMGSPENEPGREEVETLHQVKLSAFKMSKYEITAAQYCAFLNAEHVAKTAGSDDVSHTVAGFGSKPLFTVVENMTPQYDDATGKWVVSDQKTPMVNVTWYGAKAYADWVGGSLPTEAQWEYACRAGTSTAYSFGADATNIGDYAWYSGNAAGELKAVGGKLPNAWGLYDMHGNATEWCADWYGYYSTDPATDPTGVASGALRVMRGGSWNHEALFCRSAYRGHTGPGITFTYFGFRVVLP